jgi:hypothetical protein
MELDGRRAGYISSSHLSMIEPIDGWGNKKGGFVGVIRWHLARTAFFGEGKGKSKKILPLNNICVGSFGFWGNLW